ncbi:hypothetical protein IPM19_04905 [bacterium]|nr:MAG: hypothetical protein IPM19_04905 [bacterium]
MDFTGAQSIANIVFLIIVAIMTLAALLSVYVIIKYGRTYSISVFSSMVFGAIFILQVIAAFTTLQFAF